MHYHYSGQRKNSITAYSRLEIYAINLAFPSQGNFMQETHNWTFCYLLSKLLGAKK